ncbi:MAG: hypothetical protein DRP45_01240 [Candidatus Zixiibacteriota bacterium]|nr:MAG: hypothetical protein DRP45_01240 [candidate division Zixibacteria bacterium]
MIALIATLGMLCPALTATETPEIQLTPLLQPGDNLRPEGMSPANSKAFCDGEWHGDAAWTIGWADGPLYYAVYQDPDETGCVNTYPFDVEWAFWWAQNNTVDDLYIIVQTVVYAADLSVPSCPKPGVVMCRGVSIQYTLPGSWTGVLEIPVGGCCVTGPYFIGLELWEWDGTLGSVITDDGITPPARLCASYANYDGTWLDLIDDIGFPGNLKLWSVGQTETGCDTCFFPVEYGADLWFSENDGVPINPNVFVLNPIPADFFGPGSDPFDNLIALEGSPIPTWPADALGGADAVIERRQSADLPTDGSSVIIDNEIVALSLVSTTPITVSYMGGMEFIDWDVQVCLSSAPQPTGTMLLRRECCLGGTFDAFLKILPKFVFTRIPDGFTMSLDFNDFGMPIQWFGTTDGTWSTAIHPPYDLDFSPGLVAVDNDCNSGTYEVAIQSSSKFLRCENISGGFSTCRFPDPCPTTCCIPPSVGDLDQSGGALGFNYDGADLSLMINGLFIDPANGWNGICLDEADVDFTSPRPVVDPMTVDGADLSLLINALFIHPAPSSYLRKCDGTPNAER